MDDATRGQPGYYGSMFAPSKPVNIDFPAPSSYRELTPAILGTPPVSEGARRTLRGRIYIGLGIAAVLHIALGLAWWLSPPLRLKAGYSPERWVPVVSVPKTVPKETVPKLDDPKLTAPATPLPLRKNARRRTVHAASPSLAP